jgi:catechol 2,3-dioxygenase-like lactoylglutathione lyase family enzyme
MKITDADHTNWRVRDVERSLGFYRDVLGLEPFGLEEYERGEHPLVSLRVTPEFILHLRPDPAIESSSENVIGARGSGQALYVRDPDGYLIELKLYTNES